MSRQSLYRYGEDELSLIVFNTEHLYIQRHERGFIKKLLQDYQCTNKQIAILKEDLQADRLVTNGLRPY